MQENDKKLKNLKARKEYLEQIRSDPRNPLYDSASIGLVNNEKEIAELQAKQSSVQGQSVQDSLPNFITLLLLTLALPLVAGRLMIWHGIKAGLAIGKVGEKLADWKRPFWLLVILPFILQEIREVITSVTAVNKDWFTWSSFCLSMPVWTMSQILAFGVYLAIGYPACIIWCLSRDRYRPELKLDAPDGAWGVGDYMLFAQAWSLLIFIFLLVPNLLWIGIVIAYVRIIYLLPLAGLMVAAAVVAARFVWQAIKIRLLYVGKLRALGSWSQIKELNPPPDPTVGFLGAQWWSLPATILATVATFWALIQWTSLGELLKAAAGH